MSQVFRTLIKSFFDDNGHNAEHGGIVVETCEGVQHRICFKLGLFVQDGGAHQTTFCCKGDAGTKLCILCNNLYAEKSGIHDEEGVEQLTCSIVQERDMRFSSDEEIRGAVVRLAGHFERDTLDVFKVRQQAIGFRHEPEGLLLDQALERYVRPASQFCHDWMHCVFVHGVFNTLVFLLFEAIRAAGMVNIWSAFADYIKLCKRHCRYSF
jgi:hypothetical protein